MEVPMWILVMLLPGCASQGTWYQGTENNYYFSEVGNLLFADAETACQALGGHLAKIDDADENDFISSKITRDEGWWIGLYGRCSSSSCNENQWTWRWIIDDSEATYTPWDRDNNFPKTSSDRIYVVLNMGSNRWKNLLSGSKRPYICEVPNVCHPNPCQNGGTCNADGTSYRCDCTTGYTGDQCDEDRDECSDGSHGCEQGTCRNIDGGYECDCNPGFTGNRCHNDINECTTGAHDCILSNGQCQNTDGSFMCECHAGYTGSRCETDIDDCISHNCVRGTCIDGINRFTCDCTGTGYLGNTCSEDVNECAGNSLNNCNTIQGECLNTPGSYECSCYEGFTGDYCETEINECDSSPCGTGTCNNELNGYNCNCTGTGYEGTNCETDINECANCTNGQCDNSPGSFSCSCNAGYMGELCTKDVDECAQNDTCSFNGNCINTIGSFACECYDGFKGKMCSQKATSTGKQTQKKKEEGEDLTGLWNALYAGIALSSTSLIILTVMIIDDRVYHYKQKSNQRKQEEEFIEIREQDAASVDAGGIKVSVN